LCIFVREQAPRALWDRNTPAGEALQLQPGGKHVMLLGLAKPLAAGDSFTLTLNFDGSDPITVTVPVMEMSGMGG